jgi:hypothetical protein
MSVYSSTYRNVVKSLGDLILAHPAVKTFRVGPPSDIEMPTDTKPEIKYPYVHLVPQPATLKGRSTLFDFDMVVMDLAKDTEELETFAQSAMLEITRDIIAQYTNTTWDQWRFNLEMPVVSQPFVENFVNSVSGWTSQIRIEAITPISNCENPVTTFPIPPTPPLGILQVGTGLVGDPSWVLASLQDIKCEFLAAQTLPVVFDGVVIQYPTPGPLTIGTQLYTNDGFISTFSGSVTFTNNDYSVLPGPTSLEADVSILEIQGGIVTGIVALEDLASCAS